MLSIRSCQGIFWRPIIDKTSIKPLLEKMCSLSSQKGVLMVPAKQQVKVIVFGCGVELFGKFTYKSLRHSCFPLPEGSWTNVTSTTEKRINFFLEQNESVNIFILTNHVLIKNGCEWSDCKAEKLYMTTLWLLGWHLVASTVPSQGIKIILRRSAYSQTWEEFISSFPEIFNK